MSASTSSFLYRARLPPPPQLAEAPVGGVEGGKEEVLPVGIVGQPGHIIGVGLAGVDGLLEHAPIPADDLGPDARPGQVGLHRLQDPGHLRALHLPQLHVQAVGIAGLGQELTGLPGIIGIGLAIRVIAQKARRNGPGGPDAPAGPDGLHDGGHVHGVVERLADADIVEGRLLVVDADIGILQLQLG